LLIVLEAEPCI